MKNLLYKELNLVLPKPVYLFYLLAALLLIPSYPYIVGVSYALLGFQIILNLATANKDNDFTASLPVPRRDIVRAKHIGFAFYEVGQFLAIVPFAVISFVLYRGINYAGLPVNLTLFGEMFAAYGVFNLIMLTRYFKTGYKIGLAMLFGVLGYIAVVLLFEVTIGLVPILRSALGTADPAFIGYRLIVFFAGLLIYTLTLFLSYKKSVKAFERVSL